MQEVINYLFTGVGIVLFTIASLSLKSLGNYFKERSNATFDAARTEKIEKVTTMLYSRIEMYMERHIIKIIQSDGNVSKDMWKDIIANIKEDVTNVSGQDIVTFIEKTITPSWDKWLEDTVRETLTKELLVRRIKITVVNEEE